LSGHDRVIAGPPAAESAGRDEDIGAAAATAVQAAKQRVLTIVELAAAEVRLAAISSLTMLLLAIVAAAALVIAWILLVALAIFAASRLGIPWPVAALALFGIHVAVAYGAWRSTVRLSRNLTLPELRSACGGAAQSTDTDVPARS
jgi:hypothetical protein